jgi:hypothetical protein
MSTRATMCVIALAIGVAGCAHNTAPALKRTAGDTAAEQQAGNELCRNLPQEPSNGLDVYVTTELDSYVNKGFNGDEVGHIIRYAAGQCPQYSAMLYQAYPGAVSVPEYGGRY